ncbi:hypothetical protein, partial [Micromonospora globispora]|uniref:hypothetical protein n=1 Tax=Micromonospora globispora TaxID=1450148 RepID=UPI001057F431
MSQTATSAPASDAASPRRIAALALPALVVLAAEPKVDHAGDARLIGLGHRRGSLPRANGRQRTGGWAAA